MDRESLFSFKKSIEEERDKILSFWSEKTCDEEYGGFYGEMTNDLQVVEHAPKGIILNARILWAFSLAYREIGEKKHLDVIKRAFNYIINYFWDEEYSGVFWMLDYQGNPLDTKKQIYAQAFAIYGLSEFYRATGEEKALKIAVDLYNLIEEHSYNSENKGYIEACNRDWSMKKDMSLSSKDMNEQKSMNTHLHVLESYTNLYRVWKNSNLENKLRELIEVMLDFIIDNESNHFMLFMDENWNRKSDIISYGHDIEGSWLLYEAAEVLADEKLLDRVEDISVKMVEVIYKEGLADDGSIYYERDGDELDTDRHWWPQSENVIGFVNAYQLTGNEKYLQTALNTWNFIEKYIIDYENGEWFAILNDNYEPYPDKLKVENWKSPYHNGRCCFEVINRLDEILKGEEE